MAQGPLVYVVAGEPSGDLLGGRLMAGLKSLYPEGVRFAGIGGPHMTGQGLDSLFPMTDLSLMGLAEILPHLPKLMRRLSEADADIRRLRPDVVLTIDSPGFCFRLAKRVRDLGIPLVHYVAPTVWAWKPKRAAKIARFLDHLLVLLPFEPPYFEKEGLATTFVGHSVIEGGADLGNGSAFRDKHGIEPTRPVLCVLPGSRLGEVSRHLPVFRDVVDQLCGERPGLAVVLPTVAGVAEPVREAVRSWSCSVTVVEGEREKFDAFAASEAALAASGTVTLELALAGCPSVVAYRLNPLTAWLARRLIKVRFASLVNIIQEREVLPEFLQDRCQASLISPMLAQYLDDPEARRAQIRACAPALEAMGRGGASPSLRAAEALATILEARKDTNHG
ncbi:lipid-A-disaccharide synthase [Magnetospira sp. QH-2]|uniref:lipid-A-disaccharide synthase n=1 Tax=Magnetospira sp. (strain QH-2) TaxID=1288970 RepID=UPI0003E80EB3|nr:lipid-A-disaccharide synthase [Magnetospira sp. QH-2]CCQ73974.1 GT19 : related to lipid-A-disaccharide synthase [Magnetospira sp. QH-2]